MSILILVYLLPDPRERPDHQRIITLIKVLVYSTCKLFKWGEPDDIADSKAGLYTGVLVIDDNWWTLSRSVALITIGMAIKIRFVALVGQDLSLILHL